MLTALRLRWTDVDDRQWSVVRRELTTDRLAGDGCLSWHSRRVGTQWRVHALWDDRYGADAFLAGRLPQVLRAVELASPDLERTVLRGMHTLQARPRRSAQPATVLPLPVPAVHVPEQRRAG